MYGRWLPGAKILSVLLQRIAYLHEAFGDFLDQAGIVSIFVAERFYFNLFTVPKPKGDTCPILNQKDLESSHRKPKFLLESTRLVNNLSALGRHSDLCRHGHALSFPFFSSNTHHFFCFTMDLKHFVPLPISSSSAPNVFIMVLAPMLILL